MVRYDNEYKTKEIKIEPRIKFNHKIHTHTHTHTHTSNWDLFVKIIIMRTPCVQFITNMYASVKKEG